MNDVQKGYHFEKWMSALYKDLNKRYVKHNVILKDKKRKIRGQIDITYGLRTKYVECKYRQEGHRVRFDEVTCFIGKLELFGIKPNRGIFVTTTSYEKRAEAYAKKKGITLLAKKELLDLHYKRTAFFSRKKEKQKTLEQIIF